MSSGAVQNNLLLTRETNPFLQQKPTSKQKERIEPQVPWKPLRLETVATAVPITIHPSKALKINDREGGLDQQRPGMNFSLNVVCDRIKIDPIADFFVLALVLQHAGSRFIDFEDTCRPKHVNLGLDAREKIERSRLHSTRLH